MEFCKNVYQYAENFKKSNPSLAKRVGRLFDAKGSYFLCELNRVLRLIMNKDYETAFKMALLLPDICYEAMTYKEDEVSSEYEETIDFFFYHEENEDDYPIITMEQLSMIKDRIFLGRTFSIRGYDFKYESDLSVIGNNTKPYDSVKTINLTGVAFAIVYTSLRIYIRNPHKFNFVRESVKTTDNIDMDLTYVLDLLDDYFEEFY